MEIIKDAPTQYRYPAIQYKLIDNGREAGYILSFWPADGNEPVNLHIINIELEGERGKGFGSFLMQEFLKDVDNEGRDVVLHVEGRGKTKIDFVKHVNRNVNFYKKFGFTIVDPEWDEDFHWSGPHMIRKHRENRGKNATRYSIKTCDGNDDEEDVFYLYHSFGQSAGYGYIPKEEMLSLLRKNGLMSHSTIGRRKDLEDGMIVALTRDRIWFSRRMGCDFTRYSDPLVLRVKFDEEEFEDEFYTIYDDDQYCGKDRCEVFIEKSRPFAIPPWDIDYWDGNDWVPISSYIKVWKPPKRTDVERMQPSIREDFKRLGLRPWADSEVKAYVYLQPDDKMTKEEFWKLAEEQSENINRFVVFDYEVC